MSYDEILDSENLVHVLAYETHTKTVPIKGWRLLSKTSLQEADVAKVIKKTEGLGKAIHSNARDFVPLLGEEKTALFKQEIDRLKLNAIG